MKVQNCDLIYLKEFVCAAVPLMSAQGCTKILRVPAGCIQLS